MTSSWRIMIVCSASEGRQRMAGIVASWQMDSIAVASLRDALEVLKQQAISTIFCEDNLPDGNFHGLLNPAGRLHIPLIVMFHDEQQYKDAIALGAFDAVPYGCQASDIRWLIYSAMRQAQGVPPVEHATGL